MPGDSEKTNDGQAAGRAVGREQHPAGDHATSLTRNGNRIVGIIVILSALVLLFVAVARWKSP